MKRDLLDTTKRDPPDRYYEIEAEERAERIRARGIKLYAEVPESATSVHGVTNSWASYIGLYIETLNPRNTIETKGALAERVSAFYG